MIIIIFKFNIQPEDVTTFAQFIIQSRDFISLKCLIQTISSLERLRGPEKQPACKRMNRGKLLANVLLFYTTNTFPPNIFLSELGSRELSYDICLNFVVKL